MKTTLFSPFFRFSPSLVVSSYFAIIAGVIFFQSCATNTADLSSAPTHVYKGVYSHEIGEFLECNTQSVMLLSDSSQTLLDEVRKANLEKFASVYVELDAIALTPDSARIATPYDSVLVVYKVGKVKALDGANVCVAPPDKKCVTVKEFGLDNFQFTQSSVLQQEEEVLKKIFPGFSLFQDGSEYGEILYEFRRGGGSISFNVDSTQTIQEVVFSHPSSSDQFGVQIGTGSEQLKTIRSTLKPITNEDGTVIFGCPNSHIFYQHTGETASGDNNRVETVPAKFTVSAIVWRRKPCN